MAKYQLNYAAGRSQMYDKLSRISRAARTIKLLKFHLGSKKLSTLSVLDVGASTGIIDNELSKAFGRVVGIDVDQAAVNFARNQFKRRNLVFVVGDAMKIKFDSGSFDVVVCSQVYEHVPDPQKLFDEIYRVLKPGGVCYLAALNKYWPWEPHYNLPFLSWLPKKIANKYVAFTKKAKAYYETPLSYRQLTTLATKFDKTDYTTKILSNPEKFGYTHPKIPYFLAQILRFFTPTFFWILTKPKYSG